MRRRAPLRSTGSLARGAPLQRHGGLRPKAGHWRKRSALPKRNAKRRAARFAVAYGSAERVEWTKRQPCAICGTVPSECAHLTRTKAAGGTANDTGPLCAAHHRTGPDSLHALGVDTFEAVHGVSLAALAAETARMWEQEAWT